MRRRKMAQSATALEALLGLGTQMYSNALRKLPYMRDKYWRTFRDYRTVFPKVFSKYISIEILEGDGKSVGSVLRHITYEGSLKSATEKIEAVDDEKRTLTYAVIDAEIVKDYKNCKGHISVTPGSVVKWIAEYEKASQEVPDPIAIKDYLVDTFLKLDAYIQKS